MDDDGGKNKPKATLSAPGLEGIVKIGGGNKKRQIRITKRTTSPVHIGLYQISLTLEDEIGSTTYTIDLEITG